MNRVKEKDHKLTIRAIAACFLALGLLLAPAASRVVVAATPIEIAIPVLVWLAPEDSEVQIFAGDFDWIGEEAISFESEVPMPEQTVYVPGTDGKLEIGLTFDHPGNYRYDIRQTKGNESKEYLDVTYHVAVFVTEKDDLLEATVEVFLSEINGKPESIVLPFQQEPQPEPEKPDTPKEPDKPDKTTSKKPTITNTPSPTPGDHTTTSGRTTANTSANRAESVETGDTHSLLHWLFLTAAAAAGVWLLVRKRVGSR